MRRLIGAAGLALIAGAAFAGAPGAALYHEGTGAEAILMGGKLRLPAARFSCAGCHGADAAGRAEGGTVFPPIDWASLSDPARPGGAYDEASFLRALTEGIGADGRPLDEAMPRYAADPDLLAALVPFLREVGRAQRAGITPVALRVAVPGDGPVRAGLALAAELFNAAGGAFGRRIELTGDGPALISAGALDRALAPRVRRAEDRLGAAHLARLGGGVQPALVTLSRPGERPPPGAELHILALGADIAGPALDRRLPRAGMRAYLHGLLLGEALIACGRQVTRACVDEMLDAVEIAPFLRVYAPGD